MGLRCFIASCVCKTSYHLLRLFGRGATSLPGKLALRVDPNYLATLARGVRTIVFTGTNGKTTSTHIAAQALENTGKPAFYNRSGANLVQGITTEFALRSSLTGKARCAYAAIECDEGALARVCAALDPDVLVVTNVFRDQLDRYGEVMHTRDNIAAGVRNSPHATLVLNADDSIVASLADEVAGGAGADAAGGADETGAANGADAASRIVWYGVNCELYPERVADLSDASRCIRCGAEYEYTRVAYAHLGAWSCPACGFARPEPSVAVEGIVSRGVDACTVELAVDGRTAQVPLDVACGYDVYNCCCVVAGLLSFGFARADAFAAVGKFKHGFGRGELLQIGSSRTKLMLVKNPAGCNQVMNLLLNGADDEAFPALVVLLNDQDCDGTDVSWIYDAAFEALAPRVDMVVCGGTRAEDMALRLKYAGVAAAGISIEKDNAALLDAIAALARPTVVVANYSAMLAFRGAAQRKLGLAGFWEG